MTIKNNWIFALVAGVLMSSCTDNAIVDTMVDLPQEGWTVQNEINIPLQIQDYKKPTYFYYEGRYSSAYPYYNLYLMWYLKDSTGKVISTSKQDNPPAMNLFDPKNGIPTGRGMGSKKDFLILDTVSKPTFPYNGKYTLALKQYMRTDTLVGIESIGIRLESKE